ncbi:MAG: hypothetical protein GY714_19150 [Desulfobacterales bacterium]|nr:hypothetical protein [Desulfobacterales bacterium]MCP4160422.1 hypothetical protein [Deltaproteobacteria bacterium]
MSKNMVAVVYYKKLSVKNINEIDLSFKLARRMGIMQKTCIKLCLELQEKRPDLFELLKSDCNIPIVFTSAFGEIEAIYNTVKDVSNDLFPVSPTAFQHSVDNATAGYIALVLGLHNRSLTMSKGYLSVDNALYFGAKNVEFGLAPFVIIINANEYIWPKGDIIAKAEIIVLGNDKIIGNEPVCNLEKIKQSPDLLDKIKKIDTLSKEVFIESKDPDKALYLDLDNHFENYTRFALSNSSDGFLSKWDFEHN